MNILPKYLHMEYIYIYIYIYQLILFFRACGFCHDFFLDREMLLKKVASA